MKHIKKSFYFQSEKLNTSNLELVDVNVVTQDKLKRHKGETVMLGTVDDMYIGGFVHNFDGKMYAIPVPDPTLVYFNNAQQTIALIKKVRSRLLTKLDVDAVITEPAINEIYSYYGQVSSFVIFLFTAIESFVNQNIPDDYIYKDESNRKTELYNKKQIQEYLDFNTKLKKVLTDVSGKNFFSKQTPINQHITNLKEFRDSIIHTKQEVNPFRYEEIMKKSFTFKYENTLVAVAKFMNHYKEGYIVECGCGAD